MIKIPSKITKNLKIKIHEIDYDGLNIAVKMDFYNRQEGILTLLVNKKIEFEIVESNKHSTIPVNGKGLRHTIDVWFNGPEKKLHKRYSELLGAGIKIDGIVVEGTVADPLMRVLLGKNAIWFMVRRYLIVPLQISIKSLCKLKQNND